MALLRGCSSFFSSIFCFSFSFFFTLGPLVSPRKPTQTVGGPTAMGVWKKGESGLHQPLPIPIPQTPREGGALGWVPLGTTACHLPLVLLYQTPIMPSLLPSSPAKLSAKERQREKGERRLFLSGLVLGTLPTKKSIESLSLVISSRHTQRTL